MKKGSEVGCGFIRTIEHSDVLSGAAPVVRDEQEDDAEWLSDEDK
jgi:hypothetical protein